jgi:hypothetical protein
MYHLVVLRVEASKPQLEVSAIPFNIVDREQMAVIRDRERKFKGERWIRSGG